MNEHDSRFMDHALELARRGVGLASPNPTVGCVIVRDGEIIAEGFHQYDQRDHAEVVALKTAGEKAGGATMYVTLEPCNHTGRTGPCTEAIVAAGVQRVVAAIQDPNPKTSGRGFARLREAGIAIESGIGEAEAQRLNDGFWHWIRTGFPFVTLKSALTLDGQLALPAKNPRQRKKSKTREWITSEESRAEVQRMRHGSDALLTGIGTILADDPLLTDRSGIPRRRPLLRAILDSRLRLSPKSRIVQSAHNDVLIFTSANLKSAKAAHLQKAGAELVRIATSNRGAFLRHALKELGRREILSVLLESGPTLNAAALTSGCVGKLILFFAPKLAGASDLPFLNNTFAKFSKPLTLRIVETRQFGPDIALEAQITQPK